MGRGWILGLAPLLGPGLRRGDGWGLRLEVVLGYWGQSGPVVWGSITALGQPPLLDPGLRWG